MGRITPSFRAMLQEEIRSLKRSFRDALMDPERRDAFDSLKKAWSSETGTMSYAKIVLDLMLLTAAVDNRKLILKLLDRVGVLRSEVEKIESILEARVI